MLSALHPPLHSSPDAHRVTVSPGCSSCDTWNCSRAIWVAVRGAAAAASSMRCCCCRMRSRTSSLTTLAASTEHTARGRRRCSRAHVLYIRKLAYPPKTSWGMVGVGGPNQRSKQLPPPSSDLSQASSTSSSSLVSLST